MSIQTDATEAAPRKEVLVVRPDTRIPALDGLRALASLMVVFYHFGPHIVRAESEFSFLRALPRLAWAGVDLFFVLSGFLISSILLGSRGSPRYFRTFYARRAYRIFPLYYLTLLAYIAATVVVGDHAAEFGRLFENPIPAWTYLFYVQNVAMTAAGSFGPIWLAGTWSLAIEEQFYLLLPAIVRWTTPKGLCRLAVCSLLAAVVVRAAIQKFRFWDPIGGYVLLPARMDALAAGVLIALLVHYRQQWIAGRERRIRQYVLGFLLLWMGYEYLPNPQAIRLAFVVHTGDALAFAGILLVVLTSSGSSFAKFLSTRWMRGLGNMAYSTYLFHPIVLCMVFRLMKGYDPVLVSVGDLTPLAVALAMSLALSWLSWNVFERPLVAQGHRSRY
jgi:peptidoglycan/LPS O-acetylase OafA/YrhL